MRLLSYTPSGGTRPRPFGDAMWRRTLVSSRLSLSCRTVRHLASGNRQVMRRSTDHPSRVRSWRCGLGEHDVVAKVLRVGRNRCQQVPRRAGNGVADDQPVERDSPALGAQSVRGCSSCHCRPAIHGIRGDSQLGSRKGGSFGCLKPEMTWQYPQRRNGCSLSKNWRSIRS